MSFKIECLDCGNEKEVETPPYECNKCGNDNSANFRRASPDVTEAEKEEIKEFLEENEIKDSEEVEPPSLEDKPVAEVFPNEVEKVKEGFCSLCGEEVDTSEFRDKQSIKEYKISGVCQECQDRVFE